MIFYCCSNREFSDVNLVNFGLIVESLKVFDCAYFILINSNIKNIIQFHQSKVHVNPVELFPFNLIGF